jgi:FMN phosphatase YigB (HAD superfamily)
VPGADHSVPSRIPEAATSGDILLHVKEYDPEVVLLDIGGVLADDVWERLLLDERTGLAARRGLDPDVVAAEGRALWAWASRQPVAESDYWSELARRLGIHITDDEVAALEATIRGNPEARSLRSGLCEQNRRVGLLSNNTAFWWQKQLHSAGTPDLSASDPRFLSFQHGVTKSDRPGLLELAATVVVPARTVVVDDREAVLLRAAELGFDPIRYDFRERATT